MPKAKRRLSNFNFNVDGAHVALVDAAANGTKILIRKSLGDIEETDKATFTQDQRDKLAASGEAMPDGSYPIRNRSDLKNAIQAFGRGKNKPAVARHIRRRAKALGLTDLLPSEGKLASLSKQYSDRMKYDPSTGRSVPLEESGLRVNMSLEDILMFFTHMCPEDIEALTAAITKAANGNELMETLEKSISADVFKARKESLSDLIELLDEGDNFEFMQDVAESLGERQVNKTEKDMPDNPKGTGNESGKSAEPAAKGVAVPAEVSKALSDAEAKIAAQNAEIEILKARESERQDAVFVAKAKEMASLGLPKAEKDQDAATVFAKNLRTLSEAAPEAYAAVESVLMKAVDTIGKASNLSEVGADGQPNASDKNSQLEAAASDLMKEDPSLTKAMAIAKAVDANPDLYEG